jgi:hypothetical protein
MNPTNATRFTECSYDIPKKSKCPNPSTMLQRWAVRNQYSVWFVPDKNVPLLMPIMNLLTKKYPEVKVDWFRMDERDAEAILAKAKRELMKEVAARRASLEDGLDEVRARIEAVASNDEKAMRLAERFSYHHLRRAKRAATAAVECALAFDLMGDVKPLVDGLREVIKARDALYYSWVKAKKDNKPLPTEAVVIDAEVSADIIAADIDAMEESDAAIGKVSDLMAEEADEGLFPVESPPAKPKPLPTYDIF